eukprot:CAMPEP_0174894498 /NCGR_PEP_ID=MMETSP0167-20121228/9135_1 /TAXON_ID=38298 /ORGANISM="Rhodella maculata, Strain CCMP736" /LENGTH=172 /DNA_ID=CAMNT_0016133605 /DNA_START=193 /DNA_END=709 /DNA_ORIENTATION=+
MSDADAAAPAAAAASAALMLRAGKGEGLAALPPVAASAAGVHRPARGRLTGAGCSAGELAGDEGKIRELVEPGGSEVVWHPPRGYERGGDGAGRSSLGCRVYQKSRDSAGRWQNSPRGWSHGYDGLAEDERGWKKIEKKTKWQQQRVFPVHLESSAPLARPSPEPLAFETSL